MNKKEIVNIHKRPDGIFEIETFEKPLRTQIADLEKQLAEKDKEIERLKNCVMSKEEVEAIIKPEIADLTKLLTKELTPTIYKECCHQICEEIKESIIYLTGYETEKEARAYNCELNAREVLDEIDKIEQAKGE